MYLTSAFAFSNETNKYWRRLNRPLSNWFRKLCSSCSKQLIRFSMLYCLNVCKYSCENQPVISVAACNNAENVSGNQSAHGWPEHMLITNSRSGSRLAQSTKSGTQKQKPCTMLFLIPSENNKLRKERANDLLGRLTVFPVVFDFVISFYWKFDYWQACLFWFNYFSCVKNLDNREYTEKHTVCSIQVH